MPSLNKVFLIGHLGKDPETKVFQSGSQVCNFSIATSKKVKGEQKTEWHNIQTWNKTAEFCSQYLKKGDAVFIEGEIETDVYTDKQGNQKKSQKITSHMVKTLSKKENSFSPSDMAKNILGAEQDDINF